MLEHIYIVDIDMRLTHMSLFMGSNGNAFILLPTPPKGWCANGGEHGTFNSVFSY
jgi:hypothetical protein